MARRSRLAVRIPRIGSLKPPDGVTAVAAAGAQLIQLNAMFDHAAQMERLRQRNPS